MNSTPFAMKAAICSNVAYSVNTRQRGSNSTMHEKMSHSEAVERYRTAFLSGRINFDAYGAVTGFPAALLPRGQVHCETCGEYRSIEQLQCTNGCRKEPKAK
jgi:hypothetical protein